MSLVESLLLAFIVVSCALGLSCALIEHFAAELKKRRDR